MARDDTARNPDSETSLLDRRDYLRLAGAAAASVATFGTNAAADTNTNGMLVHETFEDSSYTQNFSSTWKQGNYDDLTTSESREGDNSLEVRFASGGHYGISCKFDPVQAGVTNSELQEMYANYWVKFESGFDGGSDGSKLPGPVNVEPGGGKGGDASNGTNGWSARGSFVDAGSSGIQLSYYVYHMDMSGQWGDYFTATTVPRDTWVHVEQYIKLNTTSGSGANADGELKMWVDGTQHVNKTNMRFTEEPERGINYQFATRYGGNETSPKDQSVYFDKWAVNDAMPSDSGSSGGTTDSGSNEDTTDDESSEDAQGTVLEIVSGLGTSNVEYQFTVDGDVSLRTSASNGGWRSEGVDSVTDNGDGTMTASGVVGNGYGDGYYVDGTFTDVSVDESKVTLNYDGSEVSVADLTGSQDSSQDDSLSKTIVIDGSIRPNVGSSYSFTVSGDVEKNDKLGSVQSNDSISGSEVSGSIWGGKDAFNFSGEITSLTVDGNTTVSVGGVSSASADGGSLPKKLVIDGSDYPRSPTKYNVSVSGEAQKSSLLGSIQQNDDVSNGNLSGRVWGGTDGFRYSGEITSVTLDGPDGLRAGDDV